jgi:hypothetical protein
MLPGSPVLSSGGAKNKFLRFPLYWAFSVQDDRTIELQLRKINFVDFPIDCVLSVQQLHKILQQLHKPRAPTSLGAARTSQDTARVAVNTA